MEKLFGKLNIIKKVINNFDITINGVSQLLDNNKDTITWCNDKNIHNLNSVKDKYIILNKNNDNTLNEFNNYLFVENPRVEFKKVLDYLYPSVYNIEPMFGNNVFIGENVKIGKNVKVGHNTVILDNTIIGDNVTIGCNNTIGSVGFGYEKNENGDYGLIKHIGNVVICDNVEIGNNNCIDRAVIGSTIIGENVKIDNLVHIAHGVNIGKNSLIIANSMIGGSTTIGENVWVAPSTSIINKVNIGNNSMTGIGTVVLKNIENNELHVGVPSKKIKKI